MGVQGSTWGGGGGTRVTRMSTGNTQAAAGETHLVRRHHFCCRRSCGGSSAAAAGPAPLLGRLVLILLLLGGALSGISRVCSLGSAQLLQAGRQAGGRAGRRAGRQAVNVLGQSAGGTSWAANQEAQTQNKHIVALPSALEAAVPTRRARASSATAWSAASEARAAARRCCCSRCQAPSTRCSRCSCSGVTAAVAATKPDSSPGSAWECPSGSCGCCWGWGIITATGGRESAAPRPGCSSAALAWFDSNGDWAGACHWPGLYGLTAILAATPGAEGMPGFAAAALPPPLMPRPAADGTSHNSGEGSPSVAAPRSSPRLPSAVLSRRSSARSSSASSASSSSPTCCCCC
jgi:hypothetical protein